jgi:hypothetical protein
MIIFCMQGFCVIMEEVWSTCFMLEICINCWDAALCCCMLQLIGVNCVTLP